MNAMDFVNDLCTENPDGIVLSKAASALVNNLLYDPEEITQLIIECPTAEDNFQAICCVWCLKMLDLQDALAYDGRNEEAVHVGALLADAIPIFAPSVLAVTPLWANAFVSAMVREHRTLQQSFASIVYRFLAKRMRPEELKAMDAYMTDQGYPGWRLRLPLL